MRVRKPLNHIPENCSRHAWEPHIRDLIHPAHWAKWQVITIKIALGEGRAALRGTWEMGGPAKLPMKWVRYGRKNHRGRMERYLSKTKIWLTKPLCKELLRIKLKRLHDSYCHLGEIICLTRRRKTNPCKSGPCPKGSFKKHDIANVRIPYKTSGEPVLPKDWYSAKWYFNRISFS